MKRILALVLISISLVSCQRREKINNLIKSIQTFPVTADQDIVSGADVPTEETIDGVKYKCFSTPKTLSQSLLDIVAFNPNTGKLYPGALIKGASLKDGILNDIPVKRNGGQLTISYINFKDSTVKYSEPIVEANFQNFQEAFKKLTNRLPDGNQVARLVFEKTESHELEESFLRLGISAKWLSASVKGRLEQSFQSNQSKYFVKVVQPYFDISFQTNLLIINYVLHLRLLVL